MSRDDLLAANREIVESVTNEAAERSPEIPESGDVYGWLIGSWELEVVHYRVDVSARGLRAEAHFGWVLEGRAVQDVWIMPPRPPGD